MSQDCHEKAPVLSTFKLPHLNPVRLQRTPPTRLQYKVLKVGTYM